MTRSDSPDLAARLRGLMSLSKVPLLRTALRAASGDTPKRTIRLALHVRLQVRRSRSQSLARQRRPKIRSGQVGSVLIEPWLM
jgi:hypothetical protein